MKWMSLIFPMAIVASIPALALTQQDHSNHTENQKSTWVGTPGYQEAKDGEGMYPSRILDSQEEIESMYESYLENGDYGILGNIEALFRFAQTRWNECYDAITGNYYTVGCSQRRPISVILQSFMDRDLLSCIDEGLAAQGGGRARSVHVVHAGITGDRRHSPRSLHAENRAIDIKELRVEMTNNQRKTFVFSGTRDRRFYTALRKCWGMTLYRNNSCPLNKGQSLYTGSIGWEDSRHQHHLHLSVPYCINGRHGDGFFIR